jgi:hypothetical protein
MAEEIKYPVHLFFPHNSLYIRYDANREINIVDADNMGLFVHRRKSNEEVVLRQMSMGKEISPDLFLTTLTKFVNEQYNPMINSLFDLIPQEAQEYAANNPEDDYAPIEPMPF